MWKAMIFKELRETAGIAALGVLGMLLFVTAEMRMSLLPFFRWDDAKVPFLGPGLLFYFGLIAVLFTIALGFRQTAWELWQGTFLFLLHRPASRGQLIRAKLTVGVVVYLVCSGVPLLCLAVWAAVPGTHASPFFWSMTFPVWRLWLAMTVLYLGAFASGMLDGRWFGRRLLPLVAAGVAATMIAVVPWWSLAGIPLLMLSIAAGVTIIGYIARTRDYS